jgi:DNA ligase D-like protein (predicted ligase)
MKKRVELLFKASDAKKKKMPHKISPMLATLTDERFYEKDWIYERKFDGERCVAFKNGKSIALRSRNDKSLDISYPEIKKALTKIKVDSVILDGEMVTFKGGISSFARLQERMHVSSAEKIQQSRIKVYYYIFDVIYINGYDVTKMPLIERKHILKTISFKDPLRFTAYKTGTSNAYYQNACKKGWEGLIVKKADSSYVHKRSSNWLKFKCVNEQELVIGGYTDPEGSRVGFGAILVGYYKQGKLHYAGKIGTGFDTQTLKMLAKKFKNIATQKNPFVNYDGAKSKVHWVKPQLVCEVSFTEWTKDNKLRHPSYLGLRRDKKAKDVRQEK